MSMASGGGSDPNADNLGLNTDQDGVTPADRAENAGANTSEEGQDRDAQAQEPETAPSR